MATSTADIEIRFLGETSDLETKAAEAEEALEAVAERAQEVAEAGDEMAGSMAVSSRGLSGLATITRQINPQIGQLATGLVAGHRAARGFGTSLLAVSRVLGPIAVAAGAAYTAIRILGTESRLTAERSERLADSQERLDGVLKSVQMTSLQAALAMDDITLAEFEMRSAAIATGEVFGEERQRIVSDMSQITEAIKTLEDPAILRIPGTYGQIFRVIEEGWDSLTEDQKIASLRAEFQGLGQDLMELDTAAAQHNKNLLIIARDSATAGEATGALNDELSEQVDIMKGMVRVVDEMKGEGFMEAGKGLGNIKEEMVGIVEAEGKTELFKAEERNKGLKSTEQNQQAVVQGFGQMINAAQMFNDELSADANAQFFRQQSLAMAEVAFRTGVNIVESGGNPWLLAGAIALGAAQSAVIAAQSPPSAHMGLIQGSQPLAPDETMTKVLTGEAILDRAAVNRLGGEQGVRALNRGEGIGGRVAVVVPWKHLDRELGRSARSDTRFSRAMRRSGSVTNGQRGW